VALMSDAYPEQAPDLLSVEPLVSLHFITSELRRRRRIWVFAAVLGLVIGLGYHAIVPRTYQASTLLTLAHNPDEDPLSAMQTDVSLAKTRPVAQLAINSLHLNMTSAQLLKKYEAVSLTPELLSLTATGPSYDAAVARANAIAKGFLSFRSAQLRSQNKQVQAALGLQMNQLRALINKLNDALSNKNGSNGSTVLSNDVTQQTQDQAQLTNLQGTEQTDNVTTTTIIGGSTVIDSASPIVKSSARLAAVNGLTGLIAGLGLGLLLVVIPSLMSDKLRSRFDIARALDAPVELSIRHHRRLSRETSRSTTAVVDYLHRRVAATSAPAMPLAVVAVDNAKTSALALELLAWRLVGDGRRVLVADLTPDAILARRYGVKRENSIAVAGLYPVFAQAKRSRFSRRERMRANAGELTIGRPSEAAVATGPFALSNQPSGRDPAWLEAWADSDVLLTFAELDPAHGADHLSGWATDAVVMITAGRSSGVRIQAVGNMIRRAGVMLDAAVLLDADPKDDSSGVVRPVPPPVSRGRYAGMASS
jgi:capsular polysaccharide biosynthesis protein